MADRHAEIAQSPMESPVRDALRMTAVACMAGAVAVIALVWTGLAPADLEPALPAAAVVLCLWANLLSLALVAGRRLRRARPALKAT
ncbi:hypothetical protein LNKW23_00130 [Paralimibaculum aggregatum]|uniref:Uncharacterized protein n=1 Tax=Paralimibaculum aggregatum TaxID=3036245 RepID=A0ABQ6LEH5_9RHOB|nr:hypothetical protein [Limibaculum sp. NKW23]GMG80801.1 hypothetical protein LNKW23_00130 [Limibaculum sp. NKW23]